MNEPIKIDVWSDVACPWCYIGKRKLEAGVGAYLEDGEGPPVEIEYHSFELAPDTPLDFDGTETEFLVEKGYPADQIAGMLERVTGIAESVGLHYDYEALQHTNTLKAHQLIHYAKAHGLQLEMKERLLRAYFVEGRHIGRVDDLADLAADLGLDRADVLRALNDDEYLDAVRADIRRAQAYGIQGVPFFVVDGRYGVSGAQDPDVFEEVLTKIAGERADTQA